MKVAKVYEQRISLEYGLTMSIFRVIQNIPGSGSLLKIGNTGSK